MKVVSDSQGSACSTISVAVSTAGIASREDQHLEVPISQVWYITSMFPSQIYLKVLLVNFVSLLCQMFSCIHLIYLSLNSSLAFTNTFSKNVRCLARQCEKAGCLDEVPPGWSIATTCSLICQAFYSMGNSHTHQTIFINMHSVFHIFNWNEMWLLDERELKF